MKEKIFTLVMIAVFLTVYIQQEGTAHISLLKLVFIPTIFVIAYFMDKKLGEA